MAYEHRKIFATLFFSIFATITGVGIVVPLLPIFAKDLGASGFAIGLIFGGFSISRTLLLPYFGRQSDLKGRKPYIVTGLLCYALVSVAFIFTIQVNTLLIIRFFQGIASAMIFPVVQAYVGDITPKGREGFYMGLFSMSMFTGLSIGPLAGGFLNDSFGMRSAFVCMGILAFVGCLLSLFFLPSLEAEKSVRRERKSTRWIPLLKDREVFGLFIMRFSYTMCIGMIWAFLPVYAHTKFGLQSSSIGILITLGIFISGILQTPLGYVADRVNRYYMVVMGGLFTSFSVVAFQWADGFWQLFIMNALFGIGGGVTMVPLMALAVRVGGRAGAMGSVMGLLTMGHSMGMLCGSIIAGVMMDIFDLSMAFPAGGLFMSISVGIFFMGLARKQNKKEESITCHG